eukprot:SRR837773.14669.p1 GENE.SRR837773.14669~~SRR837773.14669.p1  ORF type:complete len:285 (-),score=75.05 SRR837773.14669:106-867(-)
MNLAAVFVLGLLLYWGGQVIWNSCHTTYCGVFGRWYFGSTVSDSDSSDGRNDSDLLTPSLKVALITSFGSICYGSLLVAVVRALEMVARAMRQESDNIVVVIIGCIMECLLNCVGDMIEYFNDWAYVQCALRGSSLCEAASITYSKLTCANIQYIFQDLLIGSVSSFGSLTVAGVACMATAAASYVMYGPEVAAGAAIFAFFVGMISGGTAVGIINSGSKTILTCWAEDPERLSHDHEETHNAFVKAQMKFLQ